MDLFSHMYHSKYIGSKKKKKNFSFFNSLFMISIKTPLIISLILLEENALWENFKALAGAV